MEFKKAIYQYEILFITISFFSCAPFFIDSLPLRINYSNQKSNTDTSTSPSVNFYNCCEGMIFNKSTAMIVCGNGRQVYVSRYDLDINQESFEQLKLHLLCKVDEQNVTEIDISLSQPSKSFTFERKDNNEEIVRTLAVLLPDKEGGILSILCESSGEIDTSFFIDVIKYITINDIPRSIILSKNPTVIDFLGRSLNLNSSCWLYHPRNLACYNTGQISWDTHSNLTDAQKACDIQLENTLSKRRVKKVSDENVHMIFEGKQVNCRRINVQIPAIGLFKWRTLIIYYIATEIRGRYAHCVCSYYEDQAPKGCIPALLAEVLEFPKI